MLKTKDIFTLQKIYKKLNLKEHFKSLQQDVTGLNEKEKDKIAKETGFKFFNLIIENMDKVEEEVYMLLASCSDVTVKEIKEQDLFVTIEKIKEMFSDERLMTFFKSAMQ